MKAPVADQRKLLDLQDLDTQLAKLTHFKKTLPVAADLRELVTRAEDLNRSRIEAASELAEVKRELTRAENDVAKVINRLQTQNQRLESGQGNPKELMSIQHEVNQLGERKTKLEDDELEVLDRKDRADRRLAAITDQLEEVKEEVGKLKETCVTQIADIDADFREIKGKREQLAEDIDADLLDEYEHIRERTGGVGVVALRGRRVEGMLIDFSLAELDRFRSAAADEVIISDEHEYIIVRLED